MLPREGGKAQLNAFDTILDITIGGHFTISRYYMRFIIS